MFRVKGILEEDVTFNLETDFYVPIKIEFGSNDISSEELYYYRVLNEKSSFIETKVNSKSRKIYSVTIISINDLSDCTALNLNFDHLPVCKGNPIIDTELWNNKGFIDNKNNFSIALHGDKLYLLLEGFEQVIKRLVLPHIELLLDQNGYALGYIFYDIPFEKRKDLEEGIRASMAQNQLGWR